MVGMLTEFLTKFFRKHDKEELEGVAVTSIFRFLLEIIQAKIDLRKNFYCSKN